MFLSFVRSYIPFNICTPPPPPPLKAGRGVDVKGRFRGGNCVGTFDLLSILKWKVCQHFDLPFLVPDYMSRAGLVSRAGVSLPGSQHVR